MTIHLGKDIGKTWCGAPMVPGKVSWKPSPGVCKKCLRSWNKIRRQYGLPEEEV